MMDLEEQFNFTNKLAHPTNQFKVVYRFFDKNQAETFTTYLVDEQVEFEAQVDEDDARKPTYFGVAKTLEKKVDRLNYLAIGKHRDKFIPTAPMRWIVIAISAVIMILAVLGALKNNT